MNSLLLSTFILLTITLTTLPHFSLANPRILARVKPTPIILNYHNGALLKGNVTINLIWYGKFTASQKSTIIDFFGSLKGYYTLQSPNVASWWATITSYKGGQSIISLGKQVVDNYSMGKSLSDAQIVALATKYATGPKNAISVVLTAADVGVMAFCMNRCGVHGGKEYSLKKNFAYMWVGNAALQCPGECAWPFQNPIPGPRNKPLITPNGDIGVDGMIINLATLLANTVTNPFDGGYFQGPANAPLEAVSACTGIFGTGAYPGYAGKLLVDKKSGASFNAYGTNGHKYLLPAMWDPVTSKCKTLV